MKTRLEILRFLLPLLLFVASASVVAAETENKTPTPAELALGLQETFAQTASIRADFRQIATDKMSRKPRQGSGSVIIVNPGRMRWDYTAPDQQVIIFDNDTILMYFARSNQMSVSPEQKFIKSHPIYSFFSGTGNILRDFEPLLPDAENSTASESEYCLKLRPRVSHPMVDYLHVWLEKKSMLITRLQIVDPLEFGSVTDLFFSNIRTDGSIAADTFDFTPPPGTEITWENDNAPPAEAP